MNYKYKYITALAIVYCIYNNSENKEVLIQEAEARSLKSRDADGKIVVLDLQKLIKESNLGKSYNKKLKNEFNQIQNQLREEEKKFREEEEKLREEKEKLREEMENGTIGSAENAELELKIQEFQLKIQEFQLKIKNFGIYFKNKETEYIKIIPDKVYKYVIPKIMVDNGYHTILKLESVITTKNENDITDQVIQESNKNGEIKKIIDGLK